MNRSILIIAFVLLSASMLAAYAQNDAESGNGSVMIEYKAMARPDTETIGVSDENGVNDHNDALTRGLNKLAADNWELTAIESASIRSISGPARASASNPGTYVFSR